MKTHPWYSNVRHAETMEDALEIVQEHQYTYSTEIAEMASAIRVLAEKILELEASK